VIESLVFFSKPVFKCNIILLLTDFIHEGIGCSEDHAAEVAHARFQEKSYMSTERKSVAPFYLRLWWPMRGARMRTTLAG
jgi:hypothetical protein